MDFWNSKYPARWIAIFLPVTLGASLIATSFAQAPTQITAKSELQESSASAESPAADPALIREIMAIRNQLGGGLGKTLEGLSLVNDLGTTGAFDSLMHDPSNELSIEFKDALESIVESNGQMKIQDPSVCGIEIDTFTVLPINGTLATSPTLACFTSSSIPGDDTHRPVATAVSQETLKSLRRVARQLDQLAADLEDIRQYDHADQLRLSAQRIRRRARTAKTGSSSGFAH